MSLDIGSSSCVCVLLGGWLTLCATAVNRQSNRRHSRLASPAPLFAMSIRIVDWRIRATAICVVVVVLVLVVVAVVLEKFISTRSGSSSSISPCHIDQVFVGHIFAVTLARQSNPDGHAVPTQHGMYDVVDCVSFHLQCRSHASSLYE